MPARKRSKAAPLGALEVDDVEKENLHTSVCGSGSPMVVAAGSGKAAGASPRRGRVGAGGNEGAAAPAAAADGAGGDGAAPASSDFALFDPSVAGGGLTSALLLSYGAYLGTGFSGLMPLLMTNQLLQRGLAGATSTGTI